MATTNSIRRILISTPSKRLHLSSQYLISTQTKFSLNHTVIPTVSVFAKSVNSRQRNFSTSCSSYSIFNIPNQFSKSYSTATADSNADGSETQKEKSAVTPEIQESFDNKRDVSTEEMKDLVTKKLTEKDIFVIDVRAPEEVAAGAIPTSKNIPVTELQEALSLPNTQFQLLYQFPKPSREMDKIIFYCRSGKRSQAAFEIAESLGFKKIRNYRGSWLAWNAAQSEEAGQKDRST